MALLYPHLFLTHKNKEYETIQKYEKTITIYENEKKENDEANRKMREALERLKTETTVREEELIRIIEETKDTKDNCLLNFIYNFLITYCYIIIKCFR